MNRYTTPIRHPSDYSDAELLALLARERCKVAARCNVVATGWKSPGCATLAASATEPGRSFPPAPGKLIAGNGRDGYGLSLEDIGVVPRVQVAWLPDGCGYQSGAAFTACPARL